MRADYVCTHCQIRGCRAIVFGQADLGEPGCYGQGTVATLGTKWPNEAQWRACPVKGALTSVFTVKCVLSSSVCSRHRGGETLHYISHPFMRADYVCIHCQYRGCCATVFGWQCPMRPGSQSSAFTVKCVLKFCVQ